MLTLLGHWEIAIREANNVHMTYFQAFYGIRVVMLFILWYTEAWS